MTRQYRAGQSVEDHCRQCHEDRIHTVIVVDPEAQPLRVKCDYCGSEHNFRGGPRSGQARPTVAPATGASVAAGAKVDHKVIQMQPDSDFEATIRRIIREESGLTPVAPAEKWRGGQLVLRPGKPGVQEKTVPIDTFFNKIVMLRNRLRTLEQQVNASELPDDQKMKLQGYITGCYGSLTTFNVLFAQDEDKFVGSGD
ncbi:MAG TPA: hypothetical protein VF239_17260 [Vicinamibacterales bacterium]